MTPNWETTVTTKTAPNATGSYPVHRDRQGKPLLVCALVGFFAGVLA